MAADDVLVRPADGESIARQARREVVLLAERPELTITWSRYGAGEPGTDLHVHREHTDAFYVLDGEPTFAVGPVAERIRMPAGGFVAVPPNVVHAFANDGGAEARWLNLHAPEKGFAAYLRGLRDGAPAAFDSSDPPADGGLPAADVILAGPGEGERLGLGDHVVALKLARPDLCVAEWVLAGPLDGGDLRIAALYVLAGELDVTVAGAPHAAGPDTLASIPRGAGLTLAPPSAGTARLLTVHAPDGGFAAALRRAAG